MFSSLRDRGLYESLEDQDNKKIAEQDITALRIRFITLERKVEELKSLVCLLSIVVMIISITISW
jgi:hypothetical protein